MEDGRRHGGRLCDPLDLTLRGACLYRKKRTVEQWREEIFLFGDHIPALYAAAAPQGKTRRRRVASIDEAAADGIIATSGE